MKTLAFNVLLSSMSFVEDGKMLYFKMNIVKVETVNMQYSAGYSAGCSVAG